MFKVIITILMAIIAYSIFLFARASWNGLQLAIEQSHLSESNAIAELRSRQLEQVLEQVEKEKEYPLVPDIIFDNPNQFPTAEEKKYIIEQIMAVVEEMDFKDAQSLLDLVFCESSFRPQVIGMDGEVGLYQFHPVYHPEVSHKCAKSITCSTKAAIEIIRDRGLSEWTCGTII